jgi:hypothetical protein
MITLRRLFLATLMISPLAGNLAPRPPRVPIIAGRLSGSAPDHWQVPDPNSDGPCPACPWPPREGDWCSFRPQIYPPARKTGTTT